LIYLDHNATTPVDPFVLEEMEPYLVELYGNPASRSHQIGLAANRAVSASRDSVAELLKREPSEIVFTSGATEAINLGIKGYCQNFHHQNKRIISIGIEHKAVLDTCESLKYFGIETELAKVGPDGLVDLKDLEAKITANTVLVAIQHANNEIGVIQPIDKISALCSKKNVCLFVDGAQAAGKIQVDLKAIPIDMYSISAHKFYGPKGVGALYIKRGTTVQPLIHGGGHENGLRSGTLNVPGIVGLGAASKLSQERMLIDNDHLLNLRKSLLNRLCRSKISLRVNGTLDNRLAGNLSICFPGADSEAILTNLKNVALSSGSACTSESIEPSHVLLALGLSTDDANSSIRFGIGRGNTEDDIEKTAEEIIPIVRNLQELSSIE
jgi:cysteine desulfurase